MSDRLSVLADEAFVAGKDLFHLRKRENGLFGDDVHMAVVLVLTGIAFAMYTSERLPIATTSLGVLVLLVGWFSLFPHPRFSAIDAFHGFGHEALIAIGSLMVVGRGLVVTGALEPMARRMARLWDHHPSGSMLLMLLLCGLASGIVNDTPIVILMMPVLVSLALRTHQSASMLLMPMNYSVLVGGMATTIGTSTNLLVVSIAADLGLPRFGMFDFFPLVALVAIPAMLYLWLVLPRLMPQRETMMGDASPRVFDAWLNVTEEGLGEGLTVGAMIERAGGRIHVLELRRGDLVLARLPTLSLHGGDRLLVRDTPVNLKEFAAALKFTLHDMDPEDIKGGKEPGANKNLSGDKLAEIVVVEASLLSGRTLRDIRFAERFGLIVLGLRRNGRDDPRRVEDIAGVSLQVGDVLLVQGGEAALSEAKDAHLLVLDDSLTLPRDAHAPWAMLIVIGVVVLAATNTLPIAVSALTGALLMILVGCIEWKEVGEALSAKVIMIIVSSLALGGALTATGGTDMLAASYVALIGDQSPVLVLSSLMLLVALFTNFVSNNAAAAVGTPIAVSIAAQLGLDPQAFVLAVLFGANFSYATPMGYQTNLLVMSVAGYRFSDFLRGGIPLLLIMWAGCSLLLPAFFPF